MITLPDRDDDDVRQAPVKIKVARHYMSQARDDAEQIREALAELQLEPQPSFTPAPIPIVTHSAEARDQPRPNRLGLENLTHAPLNFRVFPETPYAIDEFQVQIGKRASLGKGAMGNVQLVRWMSHPDKPLKALKRVSKFQMWKDDNPVILFEQLWDEIEALMTLKHEHIVGLDGYFEDYKYVYLIMEYAPNGDLNRLLEDHKRLSELEAARHIASLVKALLFCHQHSYLHRDVKPKNLLISSKGDLLLADFGCVATRHSTKESLCGTRYYHSYEMANDEPHDAASDAWSVGVVAFELLHGKSPFESDDESESESEDLEDDNESDDEHLSASEDLSVSNSDESQAEDPDQASDEDLTESDAQGSDEDDDREDDDETESNAKDSDDDDREVDDKSESDEEESCSHADQEVAVGVERPPKELNDSREESTVNGSASNPKHIRFDQDGAMVVNNEEAIEEVIDEKLSQSEENENNGNGSDDESSEASSEDASNVEMIYNRIRNLDYVFPDFFSSNARDFITRLLQKDKERRMTLLEALNHPFITQLHRLNSVPS